MLTAVDLEMTRADYAAAQALADEAFATLLQHQDGAAAAANASALEFWVKRREVADALAIRYFHATRAVHDSGSVPYPTV